MFFAYNYLKSFLKGGVVGMQGVIGIKGVVVGGLELVVSESCGFSGSERVIEYGWRCIDFVKLYEI